MINTDTYTGSTDTQSPAPPGPPSSTAAKKRAVRLRELSILVSLIIGIAVFGALNPRFLSRESALAVLLGASTDGLMVIGMTIVIVCGGFDLSVGSTMAAGGLTSALLLQAGAPVAIAVLCGILLGTLVGWLNGTLVTRLKINPFITTLGTMSIVRGAVLVITKSGYPSGFPEVFRQFAWGSVLGIPIPVMVLAGATIVADLILRHLRYLRQVYFVGSNEDAAVLTGIDAAAVKRFAFTLTGVLAAISGIIVTARGNAADPNEGIGAELRVISAVIIGGASLSGGRGTILGSFLGLMLMQVLTTGLIFVNVPPEAQQIAVGIVLILAAVIDQAGGSLGRGLTQFLTRTRSKRLERILNVVLALALVIVLVFAFGRHSAGPAGGGKGSTSRQKYVAIAACTGGPYWIDSRAGLMDKAKELGVSATFTGPPTIDVNSQIDYVNKAIAQKVDGIVMIPMSDAVTPAINKAIDAGIPVVCADADAPSSKRYSFIGTGNFEAGIQGGRALAKLIGGKGKVALVSIPGADNLSQRVKGYLEAFKDYPDIKVVATLNDQGSSAEAQKVCRALLQAQPDLAGFGCVAACGGQGAAVAVREAGKVGKVKIAAMDRDEATLKYIDEGCIDVSVAQRTYTMTYLALQMLYNLRNGQVKLVDNWRDVGVNPLPPNVNTGCFLITKENLRYFQRRRGGDSGNP